MKTKYIFGTMALAAFMAACSNEEFDQTLNSAQQPDEALLAGRAVGEVVLNAGREDSEANAESRVEGSISGAAGSTSINWQWSGETDKLGGVVVDYAKGGDIVNLKNYPSYVITNYPFAPNIDGPAASADFSCPSAVVEGAYIFYSQYDGQNTERRVLSHEMPRVQTVKYGKDAGLKQIGSDKSEGGQNFFISPIVDVAVADGSEIATPLSLTSAHAVFNFVISSELEDKYYGENGLQINKIVLQTADGKSKFYLQNTIDPASLKTIQKTVYEANPTAAWRSAFNTTTYAIDGESAYAKEAQSAVLAYLTDKSASAVPSIGTQDKNKVSSDLVYQLEEPFTFTSADDVMDLYVIVPTGTYGYKSGLPTYNGLNAGALRLTIYTSEGTYDTYLSENGALTVHRNQKLDVKRTLKIKGDETNINLYDPNKGFNIESTADYEFTIDYIKNHFRDFGNSSDWKAPILNFVEGVEIDVNEGYYFPDFRVEYKGNATLNLTETGKDYIFNPKNVILDATNTPTINVVDATSSISFDEKIPYTGGTQAVELISAGKVNVNANVAFAELESNQEMNVADGIIVSVSDSEAEINGVLNIGEGAALNAASNLETEGEVNLGVASIVTVGGDYTSNAGTTVLSENATMTVTGQFDNSADITVNAGALVDLKSNSTNDGEIVVKGRGKLTAAKAFTNEDGAVMTVEDYEVEGMDDDSRGIATFATLNNNSGATINISDGSDNKGTYGGLVEVSTKLTNVGIVNVNGELKSAKNTVNTGTINLLDNAYARVVLEGTASLTDKNGNGSVVITKPAVYEMFDSFFTGRNNLADATGVIEAELDQETYNKVMENHAKYTKEGQETAWEVLNKITVKGALEVKNLLTEDKDFVLPQNASLVAAERTLKIHCLTAEGTATALSKASTLVSATVNISKSLNVNDGAEFSVSSKVKAVLPAGTEKTMNIAGKLTNNGAINATGEKAAINTTVASTGELINLGTLGTKASNNKYFSAKTIAIINQINSDYYNFTNNWYIREGDQSFTENSRKEVKTNDRKWDLFVAWYTADLSEKNDDTRDMFVYKNKSYKVYSANDNNWEVPTRKPDVVAVLKANSDINQYKNAAGTSLINKNNTKYMAGTDVVIEKYGSIQDYIAIDTNYGVVDLTAEGSKAYGYIYENEGTKKGEFTEDYKNVEI